MPKYASGLGVHVETIQGDIVTYQLQDTYDVIFATGSLHYLPPELRGQ